MSYLFVLLLVLFVLSGVRRRARAVDLAGLTFVQVHEQQLDVSHLVHSVPAKVRRAS